MLGQNTFYHVLFLYTYTHIGGRPVLLGFLRRERERERERDDPAEKFHRKLSVHFSVLKKKNPTTTTKKKNKKKDEHLALDTFAVFVCAFFFLFCFVFFEETTIVLPISNGF